MKTGTVVVGKQEKYGRCVECGFVVYMKCNPVTADRKIGIVCTVGRRRISKQGRNFFRALDLQYTKWYVGFCPTLRATDASLCSCCRTCELNENTLRTNRRKEIFSKIPRLTTCGRIAVDRDEWNSHVRTRRLYPVATDKLLEYLIRRVQIKIV